MPFELHQIKEAYIKLKSYIYYDNTDLLLRRQLVEFESNRSKDIFQFLKDQSKPYDFGLEILQLEISEAIEKKLQRITEEINSFHKDKAFFEFLLDKIEVDFYPKKFVESVKSENFVTNKRTKAKYDVRRVTAFIKAPIELHLISVLWILQYGKDLDASLKDNCLGNRLILNHDKDKVVQGSGLFKPYFKQYQKWRDESVTVAKNLLDKNVDVLFLNLDIKDYFHSVRINCKTLFQGRHKGNLLAAEDNLKEIFLEIHKRYSLLVAEKYQSPYNFSDELIDKNGKLEHVILPIGLLSSYVIANDYLKKFDEVVTSKIRPAYYGRYVDDILFVLANPIVKETDDEMQLEEYIEENFREIFDVVETPTYIKDASNDKGKCFRIKNLEHLYCKKEKAILYYFDHEESDVVIDKLKRELDERTSEFRDFPQEGEDDSFEEAAYYLDYEGSDGKIRTLKDYKENRYGLTVYLANKIFSALRHEHKITQAEKDQVLKLFKGSNCLEYYRLWEKILTFFLVNEQADAYVNFYLHCVEQIERISNRIGSMKVEGRYVTGTLIEYLDACHELVLSLNPAFIRKAEKVARNFEFKLNHLSSKNFTFFSLHFEPTKSDSFWIRRFLETNMIRHHYVIHPLLNYTKESKRGKVDLVGIKIDFDKYSLDEELVSNSPRPVKFWECCLSKVNEEISGYKRKPGDAGNEYMRGLLNIENIRPKTKGAPASPGDKFYLEEAFELYKRINQNHIPSYVLNDENFIKQFYVRKTLSLEYDRQDPIKVQEISSNIQAKIASPHLAFVNTRVEEANIIAGMRGKPNLGVERYQKLSGIIKKARLEKSDALLFPEFFIPINLLSSIVRFSEKNQILTVTGLEHVVADAVAFNFVVTILPIEVMGIKDAVVVFRLKNHYAHIEEHLIKGNHQNVPKPYPYRYDVFNWKNIYFSVYYCFELADAFHRSLLKGKIDLLIGIEWNRDTPYFANIIEAGSRDLHAYVAQVNTSQFGDTRLTQPVESAKMDLLRLKGGINDTVLVEKIDIPRLREFQRQKFAVTHEKKEFKPLPPDFKLEDVLQRINNKSII